MHSKVADAAGFSKVVELWGQNVTDTRSSFLSLAPVKIVIATKADRRDKFTNNFWGEYRYLQK